MSIKEIGEKEKAGKSEDAGVVRLSISRAAEAALVGILSRVNSDFEGGSVSKSDGASWIIRHFAEGVSNDDIRAIRLDHTDEIALLEHYLMTAKRSGKTLAPEMRDFLRKVSGLDDPQKKPKKSLQKNIINDDIVGDEQTDETAD